MEKQQGSESLIRQIKAGIVLFLLLLVLVFTLQNSETVTLEFLIWDLSLPRALIFFVFFAVGFICGIAVSNWQTLTKRRQKQP
ncbi:MAG: LapA family protein [Gammaproteobacteria bacterium]|nr:LapA family protein [Gammaproteobacteria bacterium]